MKNQKPLVILLTVALIGFISTGFIGFQYTKEAVIASKKQDVETMLTIASNQSYVYIEQYKKGLLTKQETDEKIIHFLSAMQFKSAYIWANDNFGIARVHTRKEIIGQFQRSYVENMTELVNKKIYFRTQPNIKPISNQRVLKINGITKIPEWDWVIGYGLYMDDVNRVVFKARRLFIISLILSMLMVSFVAFHFMRRKNNE